MLHTQLKGNASDTNNFDELIKQAQDAMLKQASLAKKLFEQAYLLSQEQNNVTNQIASLYGLAEVFYNQGNEIATVKLLNAILVFVKQHGQVSFRAVANQFDKGESIKQLLVDEQYIHQQLAKLEYLFIKKHTRKEQKSTHKVLQTNIEKYETYRKQLQKLRKDIRTDLELQGKLPVVMLKFLTDYFKTLVSEFIADAIAALGEPPCKYTILSLGSMSRDEMYPFSDLEFAILIEKSDETIRNYFMNLTRLLELKIINLGETPCQFDGLYITVSMPSEGFTFDHGGATPYSVAVNLITTPEKLAEHTQQKNYQFDCLLSSSLLNAGFLAGEKDLFNKYQEIMLKELTRNLSIEKKTSQKFSVAQEWALWLMDQEKEWHDPDLSPAHFTNIKELWRTLTCAVGNLALYYGINKSYTWQRLDGLLEKGCISLSSRNGLEYTLNEITKLRLACQLNYGEKRQLLLNIAGQIKEAATIELSQDQLPHTNSENIFILREIYSQLKSVNGLCRAFHQSNGKDNGFLAEKVLYAPQDFIEMAKARTEETYRKKIEVEEAKIQQHFKEEWQKNLTSKVKALGQQLRDIDDNEILQEEFNLYIPPSGSFTQYSQQVFDLTDAVETFLNSDKKTLLLLGESGSGKSFFGQTLIMNKARQYQAGGVIPIFISLPTLLNPATQLMQETLARYGFTPQEINLLQQTQRFLLVFDAFDEINGIDNLYVKNRLDTWQVKVIFTCRPSYLNKIENYRKLFTPYSGQNQLAQLMQELYVAPFVPEQVNHYIAQYLLIKHKELEKENLTRPEFTKEWLDPKTYSEWIKKIPGLEFLSQTPFLLRITMEVLPNIVIQFKEAQDQQQAFKMTQVKLYDAFINRWFMRQEDKMMGAGQSVPLSFHNECMDFAKGLAKKMHKKGITQVTYTEKRAYNPYEDEDDTGSSQSPFNEWSVFFSDQMIPKDKDDPERQKGRILARKACPIRKVGPNQYTFLHTSVLEYLVTRDVYDTFQKQNQSNPNIPSPTPSPSPKPTTAMPFFQKANTATEDHSIIDEFALWEKFNRR